MGQDNHGRARLTAKSPHVIRVGLREAERGPGRTNEETVDLVKSSDDTLCRKVRAMMGSAACRKSSMFGNCFTPKPARSGATAQLSVVDHTSQKFTESYPNAQPKASSVVAPKPTSHVSGGQDLVHKLSESAEKRCVLRSAHKHNPVQMAEEDVSTWLRLLYGQTHEKDGCCTLYSAALGIGITSCHVGRRISHMASILSGRYHRIAGAALLALVSFAQPTRQQCWAAAG